MAGKELSENQATQEKETLNENPKITFVNAVSKGNLKSFRQLIESLTSILIFHQNVLFFRYLENVGRRCFLIIGHGLYGNSLARSRGKTVQAFLKKRNNQQGQGYHGRCCSYSFTSEQSIINLLILNLVGAGVVQMENALALVLGSNLGTTLNSWIVAIFGFTYNIESFALPVAGFTGIVMFFLNKGTRNIYGVNSYSVSLFFL